MFGYSAVHILTHFIMYCIRSFVTVLKPILRVQKTLLVFCPMIPSGHVSTVGPTVHRHTVPNPDHLSGPLTACSYKPDLEVHINKL